VAVGERLRESINSTDCVVRIGDLEKNTVSNVEVSAVTNVSTRTGDGDKLDAISGLEVEGGTGKLGGLDQRLVGGTAGDGRVLQLVNGRSSRNLGSLGDAVENESIVHGKSVATLVNNITDLSIERDSVTGDGINDTCKGNGIRSGNSDVSLTKVLGSRETTAVESKFGNITRVGKDQGSLGGTTTVTSASRAKVGGRRRESAGANADT